MESGSGFRHHVCMPKRSEFVEYVLEMMRAFGPVEAKSMFGGWGLYHRGVFFGLIASETLCLKVDGHSRARFESENLEPFVFAMKDGKSLVMSYYRAPAEALESPEVMAEWARLGYAAALRARKARGSAKSAPRPTAPRSPGRARRGS
jgi:DNA transformation protein and related proteins